MTAVFIFDNNAVGVGPRNLRFKYFQSKLMWLLITGILKANSEAWPKRVLACWRENFRSTDEHVMVAQWCT